MSKFHKHKNRKLYTHIIININNNNITLIIKFIIQKKNKRIIPTLSIELTSDGQWYYKFIIINYKVSERQAKKSD